MFLVTSFLISSRFAEYARDTGLTSSSVELQKISQSYRYFNQENYSAAIQSLQDYDGRHGSGFVEKYTKSATVNNGIDEEYVDDTFDDFFGLLIEEIHQEDNRREKMLEAIVNRNDSDYYLEQDSAPEPDEEEFENTYFGIVRSALGGMLSSLFGRFASI